MRIDKHTLHMRYPSTWWHDLWREGLVTGNGEIGANVYGGTKEETTMITHHDLWHNGTEDTLPEVVEAFQRQRKLMNEEKFREASWEVVNALKEKEYKTTLESQLPVADFKMTIKPNKGFTSYCRGVHMDSGEVGAEWVDGDSARSSYLFVSRIHKTLVKKVTSSKRDLDVLFYMDMHKNEGSKRHETIVKHVIDTKETHMEDGFITYSALNDDGTLYGAVAKIVTQEGTLLVKENGLHIKGSSNILILIQGFIKHKVEEKESMLQSIKEDLNHLYESTINELEVSAEIAKDRVSWIEAGISRDTSSHREETSYKENTSYGESSIHTVNPTGQSILNQCYDELLALHTLEHGRWYSSADLSLGNTRKYHYNEELLLQAYDGKQPTELIEKLWRYGRYLFICGTSSTSNPFPLYGLWAGDYDLIWSHNMANENTQMIYWHSNVGNLIPFQEGLYDYYNKRIPTYQDNAKKLFGMNGIYMTAGTTPGVSTPNQVVPVIMNWVGAAGWIAQHYCDYYFYTKDEQYLESVILPYLEEVAKFYEDFIEFYPDGRIHFYPSVSPENTPGNFMPPEHIQMAHPMPTTVNSTIDLAIVKEFFTNLTVIAKETGKYAEKLEGWKKILDSIPEYETNEVGAIKEWQDPRFKERYDHRHLSHIYPVFPGYEVNPLYKKEMIPAFRKAVELREIDAQTGWSMAHMAAIYARLEDGKAAMESLSNMAKSSLTNNFFSLHNDWRGMNISLCMNPAPVQLDAILGYVNGIQEMVLYSSRDLVKLLPAISEELYVGKVKNFRYTGGYVSMSWDVKKQQFKARIKGIHEHTIHMQLPKEFKNYEFRCKKCDVKSEGEMYCLSMKQNATLDILVSIM